MTQETKHKPLPMAYIQEHLAICSESPSGLKWITKQSGRRMGPAGGAAKPGEYHKVRIEGHLYRANRIVYALSTATDPGSL